MTHMLGTDLSSQLVVVDTDAIIASLYQGDASFQKARRIAEFLAARGNRLVFPVTTIAETITTLIRKLNQPAVAAKLIQEIRSEALLIQAVDDNLLADALGLFEPTRSKQRTIFDALVAATANRLKTPYIFSFDGWYNQLGLSLVADVMETQERAA